MRLVEIDVARGGLVVIMLVYHCVLSGTSPELAPIKTAISFIHTAFLMMAGFLCGWHYLPLARSDGVATSQRLLIRGTKVLAIFAFANVVLYAVGYHRFEKLLAACASWRGVSEHVLSSVDGDLFTFEILVYIGVFLLLAGVAIRYVRWFFSASVGVVALCGLLPTTSIYYVACGFVGAVASFPLLESEQHGETRRCETLLFAIPFLVAVQVFATLQSDGHVGPLSWMVIRLVETIAWSTCFILLYRSICRWPVAGILPMLGRYSLLAYLGQMLIIAALTRIVPLIPGARTGLETYILLLSGATFGTCVLVAICDRLRKASPFVDRTYRAVFG